MAKSAPKGGAHKPNSAPRRVFKSQPKQTRKRHPLERWKNAANTLFRVKYYCKQLNSRRPPDMEDVAEFLRRVYHAVGMEW